MLKNTWIIILLICVANWSAAQKPDPVFRDKMALHEKEKFIQKSGAKESLNYFTYDLVYQRMEWEVDPAVRYIQGKITSYFISKVAELNEIELDLHDEMIVDSVIHNAQKTTFNRNNNKLNIQLEPVLPQYELDSVSVYYQGIPQISGFGAFTNSVHNNVPIIWTLSEPYGAMEWWPCKQSLLDKIDSIDVIVSCPQQYRTASNGILISETVSDSIRTMHWKHRFPIATYLVAIAVTNYSSYSDFVQLDDDRQIEILNYVYPENLDSFKVRSPVTADIMQLYNSLVGEYPFAAEKYGHAQFGWGGGMEHQTMSFMYNFGFGLVAHELAHQWFGDYITLASWHDIWLNEGFATYMTGLSYENLQDGVWWPVWKKQLKEQITADESGSVYVRDTTNISRIFSSRLSYSKGAYLLHMLRWVIGDDNFFKGLQNYFNDPEVANGFAKHEQFVRNMEQAADTTLTEFFDDWYYGEGFPIYSVEYSPAGEESFRIKLSQTSSHPSVSLFEMPVPVRVYNENKSDSVDFRLVNTANNQEFIVNPGFQISELKFDPDNWLVSKTATILKTPSIENAGEIQVYPNPVTDILSVYVPSGDQLLSTEIFNLSGQKIVEYSEGNQVEYDWSELPSGIYLVRITTDKQKFEELVIKK